MTKKVFVTDITWDDLSIEQNVLGEIGVEMFLSTGKTPEEICRQGEEYDAEALQVLFTPMTKQNLAHFKNAKILLRTGIGWNSVDLDAATNQGIIVCNVPDYCQEEVADHTVALFLDITRKMPELINQTRAGGWDMSIADPVPRYRGKTFALAGCGGIGRMVADRVFPMGVKIIGYDPYLPDHLFDKHHIEKIEDFDELLKRADFLSMHMPLTPESLNIMNERTLSLMKPSAYLINTSRGQLVDEEALYIACKEHKIAGAALDVSICEPPAGNKKMLKHPKFLELKNVYLTPHAAWNSDESIIELRVKVAQEIARYYNGEKPLHCVNKDVLKKFPYLK